MEEEGKMRAKKEARERERRKQEPHHNKNTFDGLNDFENSKQD